MSQSFAKIPGDQGNACRLLRLNTSKEREPPFHGSILARIRPQFQHILGLNKTMALIERRLRDVE